MPPLRRSSAPLHAEHVGYLELLRTNANVRRLWFGSVVSLFGDWFNTLAIYRIVQDQSGSALALAAALVTKLLPLALASPLAGVLVDRFDRRRVMIGADLVRAVIVLGFLFVRDASDLWLLYTLASAQIVVSAVFMPAKSALLPNITTNRELLTANAWLSATWSVMLAVGAAAGGLAVDVFGTDAVFVFDSLTYLLSAVFIARMTVVSAPREAASEKEPVLRAALRQVGEGWTYLRHHAGVRRIVWAKASWGAGGGALLLILALLGDTLLPEAQTTGMGILFAARGLGTGLGPVLARAAFPDASRWPLVLGASIAATGLGYFALGLVPWTVWIAGFVVFAHAAGGANWVLSTTMLQQRSEDRFRGRVIATDWLLVTLVESVSVMVGGVLLEVGMGLRAAVLLFAGIQVLSGVLWTLRVVPAERVAAA
ncbi:MAG: MFS transporter [Rhodothermaceae bacterium]|nr:MFS transporter [Rhodothermaceae bacterium]